jgi:hypothetical protein
VRAAAPQRRHHSCSGSSAPSHKGHASPAGGGAAVETGEGGGATLTRQGRKDGRLQWAGPGWQAASVARSRRAWWLVWAPRRRRADRLWSAQGERRGPAWILGPAWGSGPMRRCEW